MSALIDTDTLSARYRAYAVDLPSKRLLITNFRGTDQEKDLSEPPNCEGFGRIRHFRRTTSEGWPSNPLPIDPTRKALDLPAMDMLRAQTLQNAACNWRCWYCFVPFNRTSTMKATTSHTQHFVSFVDYSVLAVITRGITHFDQLLVALPGVYPSVVLNSRPYPM